MLLHISVEEKLVNQTQLITRNLFSDKTDVPLQTTPSIILSHMLSFIYLCKFNLNASIGSGGGDFFVKI